MITAQALEKALDRRYSQRLCGGDMATMTRKMPQALFLADSGPSQEHMRQ